MIDSSIPAIVVGELLEPRAISNARSMPPGMSGASVFECESFDGARFALKRWPDETKRARIKEVHRIVTLAHANGCSLVPRIHTTTTGTTFAVAGSRYWELSDWVAGRALAADAPLEKIAAGAEAIAHFHQSVREAGTQMQIAPAVQSRLARKRTLDQALPAVFDVDLRSIDSEPIAEAIDQARRLLRADWAEAGRQIIRSLSIYSESEVEIQYVLRDVHREHVLMVEDRVTGLIDFDALRIDTPATDLARWTTSFLVSQADESAAWNASLAGYRRCSPFSEQSVEMAKALAWATVWISLANWIVWILAEKRLFTADNQIVAARVNELSQLAGRWRTENR